MDKIRVLLAEDHTIVRKGLRSILEKEAGLEVIGEAEDGREAVNKAEALHPDVVVMDIAMPGFNGLEATRRLKKDFPGMKIIILTVHANEEYVFQTLQAGASGYLVKSAAPTDLISAIHAALKGESYLSPSISRTVIDEYIRRTTEMTEGEAPFARLTRREREVLQLIAESRTNKEIANLLFISIKTVETHKAHLKEKLNLKNTAELIRYAITNGLIIKDNS
ncbi:MAG: response regulator transcription factor [Thermodesulfobacteriota bacterium]